MYESRYILNWFQFCCLYELCVSVVYMNCACLVLSFTRVGGDCLKVLCGCSREEVCVRLVI